MWAIKGVTFADIGLDPAFTVYPKKFQEFKYSVCAWQFMKAFRNRFEYPSSRSVLESIPKCLHKSPCACKILKMI